MVKMVSLLLDEQLIKECREKGWHYREIFIAGIESKRGNTSLRSEIEELRAGNLKLQSKLSQFWQQLASMTPKGE